MGAHLVRAVRDRMWSTGRARRDLAVVVCPPVVEHTWRREAITAGINVLTISHGLLSRGGGEVPRAEGDAVRGSQILAVDESHNFLNRGLEPHPAAARQPTRSRAAVHSHPDQPGPFGSAAVGRAARRGDFEDETLDVLRRLERRRGTDRVLSAAEVDLFPKGDPTVHGTANQDALERARRPGA